MAKSKKKPAAKSTKKTALKAKADGIVHVKFHTDAGLNSKMFKSGDDAELTPIEYDTLHRACTITE